MNTVIRGKMRGDPAVGVGGHVHEEADDQRDAEEDERRDSGWVLEGKKKRIEPFGETGKHESRADGEGEKTDSCGGDTVREDGLLPAVAEDDHQEGGSQSGKGD